MQVIVLLNVWLIIYLTMLDHCGKYVYRKQMKTNDGGWSRI